MRELAQQLAEAAARMFAEGKAISVVYSELNEWIRSAGNRFRELENAGWKLVHVDVWLPDHDKADAKPKPEVAAHFERSDGKILIIYATLVPGVKSPKGFSILEERLYSAHGELLKKETPMQETQPGEIRRDEKACSTTAIRTSG